jgi:hypothetical protein
MKTQKDKPPSEEMRKLEFELNKIESIKERWELRQAKLQDNYSRAHSEKVVMQFSL